MFDIEVVPIVAAGSIGTAWMEGVVGRSAVELKDRCGNRVIVKIKWEDFKHWSDKRKICQMLWLPDDIECNMVKNQLFHCLIMKKPQENVKPNHDKCNIFSNFLIGSRCTIKKFRK